MNNSPHASASFQEIENNGEPTRPQEFPAAPVTDTAVRVRAFVVNLDLGTRNVIEVIHRQNFNVRSRQRRSKFFDNFNSHFVAYMPVRKLQDAIYGAVWAMRVLQRHYGEAADEAARTTGFQPGSAEAPVVWETTHHYVAIKVMDWAKIHSLRGNILEDPIKEIKAMQYIGNSSPHVLGILEVLEGSNWLYAIMPYCRGGDLFGVVVDYADANDGNAGMPEPVARYWFLQILKGLLYLQSIGVCHRDLSLENVLVDTNDCLIIDMGMCLYVPYNDPENPGMITNATRGTARRLMKPQGTCGKHNYMAPEIFANRDAFDGFAIDLWAAGSILYIMLTGFPPYDQATRADEKFDIIVGGGLVAQLEEWGTRLSPEAGDLLQSMLQLDPRDRLSLAEVMSHPWVVLGEVVAPRARAPF